MKIVDNAPDAFRVKCTNDDGQYQIEWQVNANWISQPYGYPNSGHCTYVDWGAIANQDMKATVTCRVKKHPKFGWQEVTGTVREGKSILE